MPLSQVIYRADPVPSAVTPNQIKQLPLCCPCGEPELYRRGLCEPCYNRGRRSRTRFGGGREERPGKPLAPALSSC